METQHLRAVSRDDWSNLIAASDGAWLYHLLPWLELSASVHSLENHFFVAVQDGRPLGALPLQLSRRLRHAFSTVRGPAGPFWIRGLSAKSREQVLAALTGAALEWARSSGVGIVACALPPLATTSLDNGRGVNPLVLAGWTDLSTHTRIASLAGNESDLWASLSKNARWTIKQARAAGYTVRPLPWDAVLDDYYQAHEATCRRTGATAHPRSYFEGIAGRIAPLGHSVLWAGFDGTGRPVAFHNSARFRNSAAYWTGCAEGEHLASGVSYLLFWHAMIGAQQAGCRWYDVGEAFPGAAAGSKLRGLTGFKSKFGGELFRFYRGELHVEGHHRPSTLARARALLRRYLPSRTPLPSA